MKTISNIDQYLDAFKAKHQYDSDYISLFDLLDAFKNKRSEILAWKQNQFFETIYNFEPEFTTKVEQIIKTNAAEKINYFDQLKLNLHQRLILVLAFKIEDHLEKINACNDDYCEVGRDIEELSYYNYDDNFSDFYKKWDTLPFCQNLDELRAALEDLKTELYINQDQLFEQTGALLKTAFLKAANKADKVKATNLKL